MRGRVFVAAAFSAALAAMVPMKAQLQAQSPTGVWPTPGKCANISPDIQRQCISRRIDAKERTLERLYPKALASVKAGFAKWGSGDIRMNPSYFIQAHRDWHRFVDSNCTALAAFGGGSNSSISDREAECHERELDRRIALYRQFADGTYGL